MADLVLRDLRHCLVLLALVRMVEKMRLDPQERAAVAGLLRRTADGLENLHVSDNRESARMFLQ